MTLRPLRCGFLTEFFSAGERRELRDPNGSPTARQLLRLNHLGALAVVEPGQLPPVTKGSAAAALDLLTDEAP